MPNKVHHYAEAPAYVTKDGSEIRELMHPQVQGNRLQSLAEACIQPGQRTRRHRHGHSEEIYHVTAGEGRATLGEQVYTLGPGDSLCIPPGTPHSLEGTGNEPLRVLCCCSPAYAHEDTELLD